MLNWLCNIFDVITVEQSVNGKLYEYPAIYFMQQYLKEHDEPCCYIHTKGASGKNLQTQKDIREFWKLEIKNHLDKYINPLKEKKPIVTTMLYSKHNRATWFNCFFCNKQSIELLNIEKPSENRYEYENIFSQCDNIEIIGIVNNNVIQKNTKDISDIFNSMKKRLDELKSNII